MHQHQQSGGLAVAQIGEYLQGVGVGADGSETKNLFHVSDHLAILDEFEQSKSQSAVSEDRVLVAGAEESTCDLGVRREELVREQRIPHGGHESPQLAGQDQAATGQLARRQHPEGALDGALCVRTQNGLGRRHSHVAEGSKRLLSSRADESRRICQGLREQRWSAGRPEAGEQSHGARAHSRVGVSQKFGQGSRFQRRPGRDASRALEGRGADLGMGIVNLGCGDLGQGRRRRAEGRRRNRRSV